MLCSVDSNGYEGHSSLECRFGCAYCQVPHVQSSGLWDIRTGLQYHLTSCTSLHHIPFSFSHWHSDLVRINNVRVLGGLLIRDKQPVNLESNSQKPSVHGWLKGSLDIKAQSRKEKGLKTTLCELFPDSTHLKEFLPMPESFHTTSL